MAEAATLERLKRNRLARMRQGQNTADILTIPSDPESRVALVPLLEGEYDECMRAAASLDVPENLAGANVMDREERRQLVCRSAREVGDYTKTVFTDVEEMMQVLEPQDVNYLYDAYVEMQMEISPSMETMTEEEIDFLKGLFEIMPWSDLSGRQVYALTRFLSTLRPEQVMDKSLGRFSTPS